MEYNIEWLDDPQVFALGCIKPHSDHEIINELSCSLNGEWNFKYVRNALEIPNGFYCENYDISSFDQIKVPSHIELNGYGQIRYLNVMYPWEGKHYVRGAYTLENYDHHGDFSLMDDNAVGCYVKHFDLDETMLNKRLRICFEGIEQAFYVWLNGHLLGYAQDSFAMHEFDITKYVKAKDNVLALQVHQLCSDAFLEDQDFFRFFGIYRDVKVKAISDVHIEDVDIKTNVEVKDKHAKLNIKIKMNSLVDDYQIFFSLYDQKELLVKQEIINHQLQIDLNNINLYDCDHPYLYDGYFKVYYQGKVVEEVKQVIGFRHLEIKDKVVYLNGKRLKILGVNRHEWNPTSGRCISEEDMQFDIKCMLDNKINAVRTSHYPNQLKWYKLCDENGIYVMAETNLESHGTFQKLGLIEPSVNVPGSIKQWEKTVINRAIYNYETLKNHPSILFWSLGNESYALDNLKKMNEYYQSKNDGRLIHYESSYYNRKYVDCISDLESRMYASAKEVQHYLQYEAKKPFILCEFMHCMGNSLGGLNSYMKLFDQYASYVGGFIWDFIDQGLYVYDEVSKQMVLMYGGDFNDRPSDYEFSANGLLFADRKCKPAMQEVKYFYGKYR